MTEIETQVYNETKAKFIYEIYYLFKAKLIRHNKNMLI